MPPSACVVSGSRCTGRVASRPSLHCSSPPSQNCRQPAKDGTMTPFHVLKQPIFHREPLHHFPPQIFLNMSLSNKISSEFWGASKISQSGRSCGIVSLTPHEANQLVDNSIEPPFVGCRPSQANCAHCCSIVATPDVVSNRCRLQSLWVRTARKIELLSRSDVLGRQLTWAAELVITIDWRFRGQRILHRFANSDHGIVVKEILWLCPTHDVAGPNTGHS